jgi:hypothetical protein
MNKLQAATVDEYLAWLPADRQAVLDRLIGLFKGALAAAGCKADIGKSCIRFNPAKPLPPEVLRALAGRMGVGDWIACYESAVKPASKKPAPPAGAAPEGNP